MSPGASVVVTTHYRNEYLRSAIESAFSQTHEPIDVIVVDDSGERHAEPVATEYEVTYLAHDTNRGQAAAWETGLAAAEGRYVQFLDDDDRLVEHKVADQVQRLEETPDAGVAYGAVRYDDGSVDRPAAGGSGDVLDLAMSLQVPACSTTSMLMERAILEDVSPLPKYRGGTDLPLRIELARRTEFLATDEPLVERTELPDAKSFTPESARTRWQLLEDYRDLYEARPPAVRDGALAHAARMQARVDFRRSLWSAAVVRAYWRVISETRDPGAKDYARFLVSLFGRPGHGAAVWLWGRLRRPD